MYYFEKFKDRNVEIGQIVEVYRNLNVSNAFSIRCAKTKLVLAHCTNVTLQNTKFVVSEKMRQRVLNDKRRNVHAFIRGELVSYNHAIPTDLKPVYYNPYKTETFIMSDTKEPVYEAGMVFVEGKYAYASESYSLV